MKNVDSKKRIIVIEDSEFDFTFLKNAFLKADELIELIRISSFGGLVDEVEKNGISCLLLDLKMPHVDGFDILEQIKSDGNLKVLPVIIFSSSDNPKDIEHSYRLGANAYVVKPSTLQDYEKFAYELTQSWMGVAVLPNQ